jgi:NADH-quinone oxidoreductase subunit J
MAGHQAQQVEAQQAAPLLFYGVALLTCLSAWAIVLSQNIVRMAVYLLLTLGGAAGIYFLLDAELLAAIQLIVYAGGTLILIVFGVMLTSRNPFLQLRAKPWELALGIAVGLVTAGLLLLALLSSSSVIKQVTHAQGTGTAGYLKVATIGKALLSVYLVPFEVAAVLLLVVMIAAAYMARRRNPKTEDRKP